MKQKIKNIRTIFFKNTFGNNSNSFSRFIDIGFLPDQIILRNVVFSNLLNFTLVARSDLPLQFNPELFTISSSASAPQNILINNKFNPLKDNYINGTYTFSFFLINDTIPNLNNVSIMFSLEFVEYEKF